jgi:hypothetical protein
MRRLLGGDTTETFDFTTKDLETAGIRQSKALPLVAILECLGAIHKANVGLHPKAVVQLTDELDTWLRNTGQAAKKQANEVAESELPIESLNWHLLEPSGDGWAEIMAYCNSLEQYKHVERHDQRLRYLNQEKPDKRYVGTEGFDGYVVFVFNRSEYAILENAFVGNALYALPCANWRELSKLSKTELMSHPDVMRVIHPEGDIGWSEALHQHLHRWIIRAN